MKPRYLSLDILRGITIAMMILVNNPGSWTTVYPMLSHSEWNGCTPCDLVFPFFLFCVGLSMTFALSKYPSLTGDAVKKILKRGFMIFLVGFLLNAFPFYPTYEGADLSSWEVWKEWLSNLRIMGVLQRIALCYVIGSFLVLWLKKVWKIAATAVGLAIVYTAVLVAFAGPEGAFTLEGNIGGDLDVAVFGEQHLYHGYGIPFDPEGLLGTLTSISTVLIGYLFGCLIRSSAARYSVSPSEETSPIGVSARIFTISAMLLLSGLALDIVIPINKSIWSASYVLYTAGWASFVLALLIYLVDVKKYEKPFFVFKAMGMNSIALYVFAWVLSASLGSILKWDHTATFGTSENMALLYSVIFVCICTIPALILYWKKIFIKL